MGSGLSRLTGMGWLDVACTFNTIASGNSKNGHRIKKSVKRVQGNTCDLDHIQRPCNPACHWLKAWVTFHQPGSN